MNITQQAIIISAEHSSQTIQGNKLRTQTLSDCIDDIGLISNLATGVYKGVEETSFVVLIKDQVEIDALKDFAFKTFDQESILYQDANSEAYLFFKDGTTKQLGRMQLVDKTVALQKDNYTLMNGNYYTTIKRK